jgi:hypothetical protein
MKDYAKAAGTIVIVFVCAAMFVKVFLEAL